jgi:hypothetical protein
MSERHRRAVERLKQARLLVIEVMHDLDADGRTCDCCGLLRRTNFEEFKIWDSLKTLPTKFDRLVGVLNDLDKNLGSDKNQKRSWNRFFKGENQ